MLAVLDATDSMMNRSILCFSLLLLAGASHPANLQADTAESANSEQARTRLAELRGRIAALTTRLGGQPQSGGSWRTCAHRRCPRSGIAWSCGPNSRAI
jgi:hypothetical protein